MSRLTERDGRIAVRVGGCTKRNDPVFEKLAHYEDLEEQLEKLYGDRLTLDDVINNLNRIVQNGEEKLDFARILTNTEAEKWDKWINLEEQGRLIELPCKVGDTVWTTRWWDNKTITKKIDGETWYRDIFQHKITKEVFSLSMLDRIGEDIFLTKEAAEAKQAELKGE